MATLKCLCGNLLSNIACPNQTEGYLLRDIESKEGDGAVAGLSIVRPIRAMQILSAQAAPVEITGQLLVSGRMRVRMPREMADLVENYMKGDGYENSGA